MSFNYTYSSKLTLNSQFGLAFADYSDIGDSDASVTASVGLRYNPSPLWGMDLSLFRNTQADPSVDDSFRELTAIRLGYDRKIRRLRFGLGLSYENSSDANRGGFGSRSRPSRDYLSLDSTLGMRTFANTTDVVLFMRYSEQFADEESFDAFQMGLRLSRGF